MHRRTFVSTTTGALAALVLPSRLSGQAGGDTIGRTTVGRIRGVLRDGVHVFKGVPYAAPPVGEARFLPPRPLRPWSGTLDCVGFGPRAPQPPRPMIPEMGDALTGSGATGEDCLRLNLWTPSLQGGRAERPVIVYIHGGGLRSGSANSIFYDGWALAKKHGAVVVAVNHRLNVLGYLYLAELAGERYASGNVGHLDLVAALQWVRDNIAAFGGNPGAVTLVGQSGGASKAAALMAMPAAVGLFHRAAIMSTLIESGVRSMEKGQATAAAERFLQRLGLTAKQVDRLHRLPVDQLMAALTGASGVAGGTRPDDAPTDDISTRFSAVVDGVTLPAHQFDPVAPSISADVPIICGSNETEGVPYADLKDPFWQGEITTDAALRTRVREVLRVTDTEADAVIALYRKHRPSDSHGDLALIIAADNSPTRQSSYLFAERKTALGRAPAYMYYFQWRSPVRGGKLRTMHSMELPFLFDHVDDVRFMTGEGAERAAIARRMAGAFVGFARMGRPAAEGLPEWRPFDPSTRATMVFGTDTRLVNDPYGEERRTLARLRQVAR
jgi:para-nitrobenzyl esterase